MDPQINYTLAGLADRAGDAGRPRRLQEGAGHRRLHGRARPRDRDPQADRRRQDLGVHAAQGHQVLERQGRQADRRARRRSSASSRCTARPRRASTACSSAPTACLKNAATCTLKGGVIANNAKGTVTFHLTKPDGEWLQKLAVPLASVVPAGTPHEGPGRQADPEHGPVHDEVVRPEPPDRARAQPVLQGWSKDAQPAGYPDTITERFDLTGEAQVTQVENGQADWIGYSIPSDRLNEIAHEVPEAALPQPADGDLVRADEHAPRAVQQPQGASGGQLRGRPRGRAAPLRRPATSARASCQILPAGLPGPRRLLPVHQEPGREVVRTRPGQGQGARARPSGTAGQKVAIVVERRRRQQVDRHLPAEPAQPARLEGLDQGAGQRPPVHLHPEHQEPRADQPHPVVPGLPGCVGLPERAVRLRAPSTRQRHEHQHRGLLRQDDPGADEQGEALGHRRQPTAGNKLWAKIDSR